MDTLPIFPAFAPVDVSHKNVLRALAEQFPSYSDFNFVSLFTWNTDNSMSVAALNGNVVIQFSDYTSDDIFLSFLGQNQIAETIETLLSYCERAGLEPKLKLIGQAVIDALPDAIKERYDIQEDRDNHDYILSASHMSDLEQIHPKKRTKYNHFVREYGEHIVSKALDLHAESTRADIEQLLLEWQGMRNRNDAEVEKEFAAIRRALHNHEELDLLGYGTYHGGRLIAFTLFELMPNKTAMLHFGKTNTNLTGSNEHLQRNLAKHLISLGVDFMNNQQDLGIEGLKTSKESNRPVDFLKKYTISRTS